MRLRGYIVSKVRRGKKTKGRGIALYTLGSPFLSMAAYETEREAESERVRAKQAERHRTLGLASITCPLDYTLRMRFARVSLAPRHTSTKPHAGTRFLNVRTLMGPNRTRGTPGRPQRRGRT